MGARKWTKNKVNPHVTQGPGMGHHSHGRWELLHHHCFPCANSLELLDAAISILQGWLNSSKKKERRCMFCVLVFVIGQQGHRKAHYNW